MGDTTIKCQFPDCEFDIVHAEKDIALAMFRTGGNQKLPKVERPLLCQDITDED